METPAQTVAEAVYKLRIDLNMIDGIDTETIGGSDTVSIIRDIERLVDGGGS